MCGCVWLDNHVYCDRSSAQLFFEVAIFHLLVEVSPNIPRWLWCGCSLQLGLFFNIFALPCLLCSSLGNQPPKVLDGLIRVLQVIRSSGCCSRCVQSNNNRWLCVSNSSRSCQIGSSAVCALVILFCS